MPIVFRSRTTATQWVGLGLAVSAMMACSGTPQVPAKHPTPGAGGADAFVVVGDLQRTSTLEFWREQNDAERAAIVQAIATEAPGPLITLGDHVFDGSSTAQWSRFDELMLPIRRAGIPVLPVVGNHDLWGSADDGFSNMAIRFPGLDGSRWRAMTHGTLGWLFVDSNISRMTNDAWQRQRTWFEEQLALFDRAPDIRAVFVFVHHPPFTNSTVTHDEMHVQRAFLPSFLRAHKTVAMVSGHVHAYEHFVVSGKHFVVSGGGGGPRARLAQAPPGKHVDEYGGGPIRDFHYLRVSTDEKGVKVEVVGLEDRLVDGFWMEWPNRSLRAGSVGGPRSAS